MANKEMRLKYYRERGTQLVKLAEEAYNLLRTRYGFNIQLYERMPGRRALLALSLYFLELQINHMKALLVLEKHKNLDVLLVIRSMIEGTAQMLYIRKSSDPKTLADAWWNFLHHKQKGYWHGKSVTVMVKSLERHFDDVIWGPSAKSQLFDFYAHFAAHHHWNRVNRMARNKEDSLSLGFGIVCMRYTIEGIDSLMGLRMDLPDAPLPI